MFESFEFWLGVLAVLIAYLCVSVGLRLRAQAARRREHESQSPGEAFDVSAIAPKIQQIRQDYVAAVRSHRPHPYYRTGLIAAVRRLVANLSYFRRAGAEHDARRHEA